MVLYADDFAIKYTKQFNYINNGFKKKLQNQSKKKKIDSKMEIGNNKQTGITIIIWEIKIIFG